MKIKSIGLLIAAIFLGLGVSYFMRQPTDTSHLNVSVPSLTTTAEYGATLFNNNCASCHGKNASGSSKGPPLIHKIYEPGHHSDASFYRAAALGVRSHHWQYGNMPAVTSVKRGDVAKIITYIREMQRANGID